MSSLVNINLFDPLVLYEAGLVEERAGSRGLVCTAYVHSIHNMFERVLEAGVTQIGRAMIVD